MLKVNDTPVGNLQEVVASIEACKKPFLQLELDYDQVIGIWKGDVKGLWFEDATE